MNQYRTIYQYQVLAILTSCRDGACDNAYYHVFTKPDRLDLEDNISEVTITIKILIRTIISIISVK